MSDHYYPRSVLWAGVQVWFHGGGGVGEDTAHAHGRPYCPPHPTPPGHDHDCRFWAAATIKNGWGSGDNSMSTFIAHYKSSYPETSEHRPFFLRLPRPTTWVLASFPRPATPPAPSLVSHCPVACAAFPCPALPWPAHLAVVDSLIYYKFSESRDLLCLLLNFQLRTVKQSRYPIYFYSMKRQKLNY